MTRRGVAILSLLITTLLLWIACESEAPRFSFEEKGRHVPTFSSDQAYDYIHSQVAFGPRYPGSEGHENAKNFLYERLQVYAGEQNVFIQSFEQEGYDELLELHNIIAAFEPQRSDRILLAAHWDTRPRAEEDPFDVDTPIPGADDGGSGVGVLLELARLMHENPPPIGVDIIFFDGEDYGYSGELDYFFLGSRYWSQNQPVPNYRPRFGVLLDMVGAAGARFPKELYSIDFAPALVDAVWGVAHELGYEELFPDQSGAAISDDHLMVNRYTDIPMINIINHSRGDQIFPDHWHTQQDDMNIIDKTTLQAVGDLMTELIYNRIGVSE